LHRYTPAEEMSLSVDVKAKLKRWIWAAGR
jgi:hypothetical protein